MEEEFISEDFNSERFCLENTSNDAFYKILKNLDVTALCGTFGVSTRFQKVGIFTLNRLEICRMDGVADHDAPMFTVNINDALNKVAQCCPKIKKLDLNAISEIMSPQKIHNILLNSPKLTTFSISSARCYLRAVAYYAPNVTTLRQRGSVTEDGVFSISKTCKKLQHLSLIKQHWNQNMREDNITVLLENNRNHLKTLRLVRFSMMGKVVKAIGKQFPKLVTVSLSNCGLSRNDCSVLVSFLPCVRYFDLSVNLSLMDGDLFAMRDANLDLIELNLCWTNINCDTLGEVLHSGAVFPNLRSIGISVPYLPKSCSRDCRKMEQFQERLAQSRPLCRQFGDNSKDYEWPRV